MGWLHKFIASILRPDRNADEGQAEFPEALHVSNAQVKASIRLASLTVNIDLAGALQK